MGADGLTEITTEDAFAALAPAWNVAAAASRGTNPFLRHEWFRAAWAWRASNALLSFLTVVTLVGGLAILPLIRLTGGGVWSARRLELLTVPDTQFTDMIVDNAMAENAARRFAAVLAARADWDVMHLDYLPAHSAILRHLVPSLREQGLSVHVAERSGNPCIALDQEWESYYGGRSRRLKKSINLSGNRLGRGGPARIDWVGGDAVDAATFERALADLVAVSGKSWKSRTGTTLDQEGPGRFIRMLSCLARDHGWLSIWLLYHDGQPVASEYQLIHEGNVYALRADFDPALAHLSPGTQLFRRMLEALFARGLSRYHLGPGNNAYKRHWAETATPLQHAVVYNRTWLGQAARLKEHAIKPPLRALRHRLWPHDARPPGKG